MIPRALFCISFLCAVLLLCPALHAGQKEAAAIDPQADKVLRQMSEYLNSLQQFTIHVENTTDVLLKSGHKMQVGSAVDVSVRRPDRMRADIAGDLRSQQLFYDGKSITGRKVNYYATMEVPSTMEEALDHARESFGLFAPAADLVSKNSYDILTEDVTSGDYIGLHKVHGVECHHLLFTQDEVDWQIWIENSKTPLPRLSPKLPDNLFVFVPPDMARKIEFLPAE
jgi:hypothetical protein